MGDATVKVGTGEAADMPVEAIATSGDTAAVNVLQVYNTGSTTKPTTAPDATGVNQIVGLDVSSALTTTEASGKLCSLNTATGGGDPSSASLAASATAALAAVALMQ